MNITKESIGKQNELVTIRLQPDDYNQQLEQSIRKAKKQMSLPGFRPGHVPEGLVRKKYGKSLLIDELNRIVTESLDGYIREQNLKILGKPLLHKNGHSNDFDVPGDFEFSFELGLAPEFTLTLPPAHVFPNYVIEVDRKQVDEEIDWIRKRFGDFSYPEVSGEASFVAVAAVETDADSRPVEKGLRAENRFAINDLVDTKLRELFLEKKKEDTVVVEFSEAAEGADVMNLLGVRKEELKGVLRRFEVKITEIADRKPAELNQELFDKALGKDVADSEEAFIARITESVARSYAVQSDRKLAHDIEDELLRVTEIDLPDEFLKRWLVEDSEKPPTPEEIEKKYGSWSRAMKWKMIQMRIESENNITVSEQEVTDYARRYVAQQLAEYGGSYLTEELIGQMGARYLEKEENRAAAYDALVHRKVFEYLNTVVRKKEHPVSLEEFRKILHEHTHAH